MTLKHLPLTSPGAGNDNTFIAFDKRDIEQSIPSRFARIVAEHGPRLAIRMNGRQVSYSGLDSLSNGIGHSLLAMQSPRQEPVGILMAQGIAPIAAILGILKAGHLYVPLSTDDPPDRIAAILVEAGIGVIVTDSVHMPMVRKIASGSQKIVDVDSIDRHARAACLEQELSPEDAAYIFYTSGSTGRAKGVVDSHRNVLHNIMRYTNKLRICREDRLSLVQASNFSGSVSSIFCALLNGAALFPFDLRQNGIAALADLLVDEGITIYHSVPYLFEQLLGTGREFPDLRVIRLEGDQCAARHVALYQRHFRDKCVLANGLGATETGLTHQYLIDPGTRIDGPVVAVGYPLDDMDALILDDAGQALPPGQRGELAIRSAYLAKGYWRNEALTKRAFEVIPGSGQRLYRTGDVGRIAADGKLEHLGRTDFRVKIRGHSVHVEAVESALLSLPGISHAYVQSQANWSGHPRLIAYLMPDASGSPGTVNDTATTPGFSESRLRQQLLTVLPPYMIPARFIALKEIPTDANGKVSRQSLQAPDKRRPTLEQPFAAPQSATERTLVMIWQELLQLDQVGVNDDFFDLGGDSMLAISLPIVVEERTGKKLSDASLLQARTVRELAGLMDQGIDSRSLVGIQPNGTRTPFFCIHSHTGRVLEYRDLAAVLGDDQPFYALQPRGYDGNSTPLTSIEDMATHYLREIRELQPHGPYRIGGYCFGALIAYEMARQLLQDGYKQNLVVLIDPDNPRPDWRIRFSLRQRMYRMARALFSGYTGTARRNSGQPDIAPMQRAPNTELSKVERANSVAGRKYKPGPCGSNMTIVCVETGDKRQLSNHAAWRELISGKLEVIRLPKPDHKGDYKHLFHAPYVTLLANTLGKLLGP